MSVLQEPRNWLLSGELEENGWLVQNWLAEVQKAARHNQHFEVDSVHEDHIESANQEECSLLDEILEKRRSR